MLLRHPAGDRLSDQRAGGHPARHVRHHLDQPVPDSGRSRSGSCCNSCPSAYIAWQNPAIARRTWTAFTGEQGAADGAFDLLLFGAAAAVVFSLLPQIGEQVDFLRFLPRRARSKQAGLVGRAARRRPRLDRARRAQAAGRLVPGGAGAAARACPAEQAVEPTQMYLDGLRATCCRSPTSALVLTRRVRRGLAAQDQRHQRLCRLARLVELLLAPDAQPSGPRGVAGVQRAASRCC